MTAHAKIFRPSAAHRWMNCPGSVVLEAPFPDTSSSFADEGTLAHWVASWALESERDAIDYFDTYQGAHDCPDVPGDLRVTEDMCKHVQVYVDAVRRALESGAPGELLVEQRVSFQDALGVTEEASGTADAIILRDEALEVHDLKFGMGERVDAEDNEQLLCYALGVLEQHGHLADFKRAKLVIHQPRLDHRSEWEIDVAKLQGWGEFAKDQAAQALRVVENPDAATLNLFPGAKTCRWCKAKAVCPALREEVARAVEDVPAEQAAIDAAWPIVELAEQWAKAMRAQMEANLLAGKSSAVCKLVEGRRGARSWTNAETVEALLKDKFRAKQEEMYEFKLISPTAAEKIYGGSKKRWGQLEKLIEQKPGKPSVAPIDDKRPALNLEPSLDGMAAISTDEAGGLDSLM